MQHEEAEREEREIHRESLLSELSYLQMQPEEHPEHNLMLTSKLLVLGRADQLREERNQEILREIGLIDQSRIATGFTTEEQGQRRQELFSENAKLFADLNAANRTIRKLYDLLD